jgi:hypothetical protein
MWLFFSFIQLVNLFSLAIKTALVNTCTESDRYKSTSLPLKFQTCQYSLISSAPDTLSSIQRKASNILIQFLWSSLFIHSFFFFFFFFFLFFHPQYLTILRLSTSWTADQAPMSMILTVTRGLLLVMTILTLPSL